MVRGDFNVVVESRKRISIPYCNFETSIDFNNFIANASLSDIGYSGNKGARHIVGSP